MKRITLLLICSLIVTSAYAQQDTTSVKVIKKNVVTVTEDMDKTQVKIGEDRGVEVITNHRGDTTSIRIGNRNFDVIDNREGTKIHVTRESREKRKKYGRFNGHWAGFEMGVNTFHESDYSLYDGMGYGEFFDLNHAKSLTININFAEYTFSNDRNTFGLVTGLGLNMMDFRFDQPMTLTKESSSGLLLPVELDSDGFKKSKLNVTYLTAPIILEIATPLKYKQHRLTLGAGVIGGVNVGSRTKIKTGDGKTKDRRNFNINPLKYDLTGRIGLGELCVFANYGMTSIFEEGKGPQLVPLTIGISFPNVSF
jgi:hypothetical protein